MKDVSLLETRSAEPLETRNGDDAIANATQAVEELKTAVNDFRTKTDEKIASELKAVTDRLDAIEVRSQRPGAGGADPDEAKALEKKAFLSYLRHGREALPAEEIRSLRVSDDTAGGYLATSEFSTEVVKGITEFSPVRQAARVGSTSSGEVILPKRTGKPTAHWVGETEERPETGATYGQLKIPVHEMACFVDVSQRLLEDAAVNIEAEVSSDLAEEFGRLEGAAFVDGDGVEKPSGFMQDTTVAYSPNGHATTLQPDGLIGFIYSMPAFYRNRGVWMMNSTTLAAVRKLKDGQNNYLWQPSFQAGQPETILGRPVIEAVDMPAIAANAFPIAFGAFDLAYRIYDRVALSIMRDPYSVAKNGLVRFHARRRVGGGVRLAEAIRKLKMSVA
ncbi:MAG: phage major capsid protein [Beijerinckiaceae bacterium]